MKRSRTWLAWVALAATVAGGLIGCMVREPIHSRIETDAQIAATHRVHLSEQLAERLDEAVLLVVQLEYDQAQAPLYWLADQFDDIEDTTHAAEAWFWLGYCHEKRGQVAVARDLYGRVAALYRAAPASRIAERRLQRLSEPA